MAEIANIIKKIANEGHKIQTCPAKVIAINNEGEKSLHNANDAYTVDVVRPDGAVICNVRLKASIQDKDQGLICIPKMDSWVLISIIETTETRAFISLYSEIDKIFLRIKNDDDHYFQVEKDASSLNLLFKEKKPGTPSNATPEYKNVSQVSYGGEADKSLNVQFFNDQDEEQVVVQATIDVEKVDFQCKDDEGNLLQQTNFSKEEVKTVFQDNEGNLVQQTSLSQDEVKTVFEEGYQTLITKDKVQFTKDQLNLEMDDKFMVSAGGNNLKDQLDMLIDEISKIIVVQGTGPNIGALNTIKANLGNILKT